VLEDLPQEEDDWDTPKREDKDLKIFEDSQVFEKGEKVLGMSYSFEKDVFSICVNEKWKDLVTTQRQMMKLTACMFDPLGFFCPFVLMGQLLFHEATDLGLKWDDWLPEDITIAFDEWRRQRQQEEGKRFTHFVTHQKKVMGVPYMNAL
jgi:hypothetical protein